MNKYSHDIEQAAYEIGEFCKRWGFISVRQTKEKFGTARVYCDFGISTINELIWCGYHYNQWTRFGKFGDFMHWFDQKIIYNFTHYSKINTLIVPYQQFIYKLAYKRAMQKFPHVASNIRAGADYRELLKDLCSKKLQ